MPSYMQHSVYAISTYTLVGKKQGKGKVRRQHVTGHVISEVAVAWIWEGKGLTFSSVWSTPVAICDSVRSDSYSVASI